MSSPSLDLAEYLEAEGVGTFGGNTQWSLHTTREPAEPNDVVTLYDTGGPAPILIEETDDDDESLYRPSVQVRVRSADKEAGHTRQRLIRRTLSLPTERIINDHRYVLIAPTSDILDLGFDENDRYLSTVNYDIIRHPLEEAAS